MSVQKHNDIIANDLKSIATLILNELSRRSQTAGTTTFTQDNPILVNNVNTLINNLKIIDNSSWIAEKKIGDLIKADEWNTLSTKVATLAALTGKGNSSSGCSGSCVGLCEGCSGDCVGTCSGCSGSCSGSCSGCTSCWGCSGSCQGTCQGCGDQCATACGGYCLSGDCTGTCFSGLVQTYPGCSGGYA